MAIFTCKRERQVALPLAFFQTAGGQQNGSKQIMGPVPVGRGADGQRQLLFGATVVARYDAEGGRLNERYEPHFAVTLRPATYGFREIQGSFAQRRRRSFRHGRNLLGTPQ